MTVSRLEEWAHNDIDNQHEDTQNYMLAVLGLISVCVIIAMINAAVISAADRRAEFATARLTGLTRRQVIHMAVWESLTVVLAGAHSGGPLLRRSRRR